MILRTKRNPAGLAALGALACLTLSHAALMPRMSFEELVSRSEVIAQAQVISSWSAWDDEHRYIWTHYQMQVTDSIRGNAAAVVVSEPGGTVDGVNQGFSGMNAWTPGENVIVFLHRVPNGYLRTTGGSQGVARISSEGRVSINVRDAMGSIHEGTDLRRVSGLPLAEFRDRLRTAVEQNPLRRNEQ